MGARREKSWEGEINWFSCSMLRLYLDAYSVRLSFQSTLSPSGEHRGSAWQTKCKNSTSLSIAGTNTLAAHECPTFLSVSACSTTEAPVMDVETGGGWLEISFLSQVLQWRQSEDTGTGDIVNGQVHKCSWDSFIKFVFSLVSIPFTLLLFETNLRKCVLIMWFDPIQFQDTFLFLFSLIMSVICCTNQ